MKKGKKITVNEEDLKEAIISSSNEVYSDIKEMYDVFSGGIFLLGLGMGITCRCPNREEAIEWVRRNFGYESFLINFIDKALEAKNKCIKCNSQNDKLAKFCCQCGEKLRKEL